MKVLHILDGVLTRVANAALVILFIVMSGLAAIQVILRYFFNGSLLWGDVAARVLVMWVGFLGAVLATRENKHFHIDVLTRFLKKRYQSWFFVFSNLFSAVVCYFLGQASITFLGLDGASKTFLDLPVFVVDLIIPIGFYLMMVQFVLRAVIVAADEIRRPLSSDRMEA